MTGMMKRKQRNNSFSEQYGPWALVTGASRGIGAEFARQCAARGLNIIMVATNKKLLKEVERRITSEYGVEAVSVVLDLGREDILERLAPAIRGREIGLLVCNAGVATVQPFLSQTGEELVRQFHVNARAALMLARHCAADMARRKRGGIILLSSASAMNGTAYSANYAGTKAYNLILAESLWYELGAHNIDVLGFMPGCTKTPGFEKHNPRPGAFVPVMGVEETVAEALHALGRYPSRIAGMANRLSYLFMGLFVSRRQAIRMVSRSMKSIFNVSD